MKVMCIKDIAAEKGADAIQYAEICTVIDYFKYPGLQDAYVLEEHLYAPVPPAMAAYYCKNFIPLSDIDETDIGFEIKYQENHTLDAMRYILQQII